MKQILFLSFNSFLWVFSTPAQNLVPNAGFEHANRMPDAEGNSINRAKEWIAPKYSSDYYYEGAGRHAGTPKNIFGRQKPHSGKAYAGICTRTHFLEYVECKLTDTLIKDQEYLVEFYISRAERSLGSLKEFGVLFTTKKMWGLSSRGIAQRPQVEFINKRGYKNKKKWMKLSAVYKAEGDELVLILGHFNYDPKDDKRRILCHYYIDDISVIALGTNTDSVASQTEEMELKKEEEILPSFSPKPGEVMTLRNIFFQTNKSALLPESFAELDKLALYLNEETETTIDISGHTDNSGNEKQNKNLSEARAKAVAEYLSSKGIDPGRVQYSGYGSTRPVATNTTEEGKQKNRRVEFVITKN